MYDIEMTSHSSVLLLYSPNTFTPVFPLTLLCSYVPLRNDFIEVKDCSCQPPSVSESSFGVS